LFNSEKSTCHIHVIQNIHNGIKGEDLLQRDFFIRVLFLRDSFLNPVRYNPIGFRLAGVSNGYGGEVFTCFRILDLGVVGILDMKLINTTRRIIYSCRGAILNFIFKIVWKMF
jgi:hypothetical protein